MPGGVRKRGEGRRRVVGRRAGRLVHPSAPVQRADLEIAGAAAAILGSGLDELFTIEAHPRADDGEEMDHALADIYAPPTPLCASHAVMRLPRREPNPPPYA